MATDTWSECVSGLASWASDATAMPPASVAALSPKEISQMSVVIAGAVSAHCELCLAQVSEAITNDDVDCASIGAFAGSILAAKDACDSWLAAEAFTDGIAAFEEAGSHRLSAMSSSEGAIAELEQRICELLSQTASGAIAGSSLSKSWETGVAACGASSRVAQLAARARLDTLKADEMPFQDPSASVPASDSSEDMAAPIAALISALTVCGWDNPDGVLERAVTACGQRIGQVSADASITVDEEDEDEDDDASYSNCGLLGALGRAGAEVLALGRSLYAIGGVGASLWAVDPLLDGGWSSADDTVMVALHAAGVDPITTRSPKASTTGASWPRLLVLCLRAAGDTVVRTVHAKQTVGLFDSVREWPASASALRDLAATLEALPADAAGEVAAGYAVALQQRLLQPGASTSAVVEVLLATARCLRVVDPSGVVLQAASEPVRKYLQQDRPDAVKRVVSMLMDDGRSTGKRMENADAEEDVDQGEDDDEVNALRQELESGASAESSGSGSGMIEQEDDEEEEGGVSGGGAGDSGAAGYRTIHNSEPWSPASMAAASWQRGAQIGPTSSDLAAADTSRELLLKRGITAAVPLSAQLGNSVEPSSTQDLLWGVTQALGGTKVLAGAYEERLASQLLTGRLGWSADDLVITHELLKARIGEREVHGAEVMLKDLADSRRAAVIVAAAISRKQGALASSSESSSAASAGAAEAASDPLSELSSMAVHPIEPSIDSSDIIAHIVRDAGEFSDSDSDDEQAPGQDEASRAHRRAEKLAHKAAPLPLPQALVLSRGFWPGLGAYGGDTPSATVPALNPHPRLHDALAHFTKEFEAAKAPRKLNWLTNMGCVTIEVALPDDEAEVVSATGSIAQVSALLYVVDAAASDDVVTAWRLEEAGVKDGCVSASALAKLLGVQQAEATSLLRFWVRKRVLVEADAFDDYPERSSSSSSSSSAAAAAAASSSTAGQSVFMVRGSLADQQRQEKADPSAGASDAMTGSASASAGGVSGTRIGQQEHEVDDDVEEQEEDVVGAAMLAQQTALVRNFGIGMMRSRGAMRLQDVLVTLRTFASYSGSESELRSALEMLVEEGLLVSTGDEFSIKA